MIHPAVLPLTAGACQYVQVDRRQILTFIARTLYFAFSWEFKIKVQLDKKFL